MEVFLKNYFFWMGEISRSSIFPRFTKVPGGKTFSGNSFARFDIAYAAAKSVRASSNSTVRPAGLTRRNFPVQWTSSCRAKIARAATSFGERKTVFQFETVGDFSTSHMAVPFHGWFDTGAG